MGLLTVYIMEPPRRKDRKDYRLPQSRSCRGGNKCCHLREKEP